MSSSKRASNDSTLSSDKRLKIVSELASIHGVSKVSLAKTLKALYDRGLLTDALVEAPSANGYRRQVQKAFERDALYKQTPYGPMLCEMELPTKETNPRRRYSMWYVHPFALLYSICILSAPFFNLIKVAVGVSKRLRIILYFDGVNPGNPLAPDPQRLLQAVYWCFAELPTWFLRRKDAWFIFSLVREKWAEAMPGKLSELAKLVLRVFFSPNGESFHKGITIQCGSESIVVVASFAGFLADEKGLKQLLEIKGQAGSLPCLSCLNIRNRWVKLLAGDGNQHFWDPDLSKRKQCTHDHVKMMVKRLEDAPTQTMRTEMQVKLGINYVPTGLLFDKWLMDNIVDLPSNYIRDWMHTFVSNGVAGSHLALLCGELANVGIGIHVLQAYSQKFILPTSRGKKVSELYFQDHLVSADHVRHFASDVLGMVSIMYAFLLDKVAPRGLLLPNIECFKCLYKFMCILRKGDMSEAIRTVMKDLIVKHNRLWLELYGNIPSKIKFHHSYHIPDDMLYLLHILSCFVTERKNKDAIAVSVASDRHMEKTSVISFLHKSLSHWEQHITSCTEMYLCNARTVCLNGQQMESAKKATLPCGDLFCSDMVLLFDGSIGKITSFWQIDDAILVGLEVHRKIPNTTLLYELEAHTVNFIDARLVVELVSWYPKANALLVIVSEYC